MTWGIRNRLRLSPRSRRQPLCNALSGNSGVQLFPAIFCGNRLELNRLTSRVDPAIILAGGEPPSSRVPVDLGARAADGENSAAIFLETERTWVPDLARGANRRVWFPESAGWTRPDRSRQGASGGIIYAGKVVSDAVDRGNRPDNRVGMPGRGFRYRVVVVGVGEPVTARQPRESARQRTGSAGCSHREADRR